MTPRISSCVTAIEKTRRSSEPNFLNRWEVVHDAYLHLCRRQNAMASPATGATAILRPDHARILVQEHEEELSPVTKTFARILTRVQGPFDLAAARAAVFASLSRRPIRQALRRVPVGMLPTMGLYASQESAPKGGPAVLLGLDFLGTISSVAEWCIAATPYWGPAEVDHERAGDAILRRLQREVQPLRIRSFVKDMAMSRVPEMAVYFALAHKYAHIFNQIIGRADSGHDIEYEADALGFDLAMDVARHPLHFGGSKNRGAAGAEIVLQTIALAEDVGVMRPRVTHPSARVRLERLHEHLRVVYGARALLYLRPYQACFEAARRLAARSKGAVPGPGGDK